MTDHLHRATEGEEIRVDYAAIEKTLAELWRSEQQSGDDALTRAALWNVVAHTATADHHTTASETLGRASASVPQRTIVIRANPWGHPEIASWISANCHMVGGGKQVCSEEISIVAGGERIHHVPPLVSALLIPDMPVAIWWVGDLPSAQEDYVRTLLDPADRLIVDSVHFDSPADLTLVSRIAAETTTSPADLNWVRLEEWRVATAAIFDPPEMREHLRRIRRVRIAAATSNDTHFGQGVEALLYAAWVTAQLGHVVSEDGGVDGGVDYAIERRRRAADVGGIAEVSIEFEDGTHASIERNPERGVLVARIGSAERPLDSVTRTLARGAVDLIVRQLKRPESDRVLVKVLPIATRLAKRIA